MKQVVLKARVVLFSSGFNSGIVLTVITFCLRSWMGKMYSIVLLKNNNTNNSLMPIRIITIVVVITF